MPPTTMDPIELPEASRPDDIIKYAEDRLNAQRPEPKEKPEPTPQADPVTEPEAPETKEPAADPDDAAKSQVTDADRALADPLAERQRELDARESAFNERERLAREGINRLLADPNEYARARKELGIETPEADDPRATGPDPFKNPDAWRYQQTLAYQRLAERDGKTWTAPQIREAVERDLGETRAELYANRLDRIERAEQERERQGRETVAQHKARMDADAQEKALGPLMTAAWPKGVPSEARENVDAHIALARARGQKPDLAAVVAKVSGLVQSTVKTYIAGKKDLAARTQAAASRGSGETPAPVNPIDRLPATLDSITAIGEMRAGGKIR